MAKDKIAKTGREGIKLLEILKIPRDVGSIMRWLREKILFKRPYQTQLRFEGVNLAKRTQTQPELPDGVSHRIFQNYYFQRDARRSFMPPEVTFKAQARLEDTQPHRPQITNQPDNTGIETAHHYTNRPKVTPDAKKAEKELKYIDKKKPEK